ncbi:hypothetical protein D6D05_05226 [Aureobasidium pullulans]|nr:hypothetical protein D6D05_05226 [Aureobasidium pullulans]
MARQQKQSHLSFHPIHISIIKMRFSSYALPALAANLVAALPAPQEIDLDMVLDTPDPTFSQAVGVVAQTITYDTASMIAVATAAASSVSIEISDVLSQTAVVSKRAAPTTCVPQPSGATSAPTYAAGTDNAANFLANNYYSSVASAAPTPSGYNMAFVNQQASNNAFGYMGFSVLDTYDVATCASRCTALNGCVSINIYFERDPSVDPNDASCSNPPSVTMIKCVYWGGPVSQDNAVNSGQTRGSFSVVIAGSNGYVTNQIKTPAGYQAGTPYGKYAINAPYDAQGYNTFMGSKIFTSTWDVASCSAYCDSQTAYNKATAPKDGTPYKVCNFFNTYVLTAYKADGTVVPQGQYCALYTEAWTSTYAVNGGQWRGQDQYLVNYSFGYSKTNPGISPTVGDANGAAYQAVADIKWATLQPFCSSYLGYTTPITTIVTSTTSTPIATAYVSATAAGSTIYHKRDDSSITAGIPASIVALMKAPETTSTVQNQKRALSTPAVLTKYQSAVLTSACQMQATRPATSTSVITNTVTASTSTTTVTTTVATAASTTVCRSAKNFKMQVVAPGTPYDGATVQNPDSDGYFFGLSVDQFYAPYAPIVWTLDQNTGYLQDVNTPSLYASLYLSWNLQMRMGSVGENPLATCSVDPNTALLTCSNGQSNTFYVTSDSLIQLSLAPAGYSTLGDGNFVPVPVQVRAIC